MVGESGSGKSVTMMSLLKLLPMPPAEIVSGRALLEGEDLIGLDADALRRVRGARVGFIFQDPMTSLNPVLSVGYQLTEPLRLHLGMRRREARRRAIELLERVGIPAAASRLDDFPHQFSGRDAPAGDDRHRARLQPQGADCRRADHRAGRHHPGADPRCRQEAQARVRHRDHLDHPRPRSDGGPRGPDHGDVRGAGGRTQRASTSSTSIPAIPTRAACWPPCRGWTARGRSGWKASPGSRRTSTAWPAACPFAPRCGHAFERCRQENPALRRVVEGHEVACWPRGRDRSRP